MFEFEEPFQARLPWETQHGGRRIGSNSGKTYAGITGAIRSKFYLRIISVSTYNVLSWELGSKFDTNSLTKVGDNRLSFWKLCIGEIEASTSPSGHTPGIWHLCRPGEEGIWLSESSRGWGIWSPCVRGGEFELHPRFHVKSLAWRAIMGNAVLEDFWGKHCAFVANWLRGMGLNNLCAVFEGI